MQREKAIESSVRRLRHDRRQCFAKPLDTVRFEILFGGGCRRIFRQILGQAGEPGLPLLAERRHCFEFDGIGRVRQRRKSLADLCC